MNLPHPPSRTPRVYLALIVINVLLFVVEVARGVGPIKPNTSDMIAWGANVAALTLTGDTWRLLSSMFLHGGLIHIALNMYMLYMLGPLVEEQFGSARFTLIYLLSGLFSGLADTVYHAASMPPVAAAGASGALMGIAGAFIGQWLVFRARRAAHDDLNVRPLVLAIGINLLLGFIVPGVDNAGHIGGLIGGVILGAVFELGAFAHDRVKRGAVSVAISLASLAAIHVVLHRPQPLALTFYAAQLRFMQAHPARGH